MRACWLKWVGRDWSISADYIWLNYSGANTITKAYQRRFRTEGSAYYETLQRIIDGNTKRIVSECQAYLDRYEREGRPRFAVNIDHIVGLLEGEK